MDHNTTDYTQEKPRRKHQARMFHWNGLCTALFIFHRFRLTLLQSFELIHHLFRCISSVTPILGKYSNELNIQSHLTYLDLVIKEKIRLYLWFHKVHLWYVNHAQQFVYKQGGIFIFVYRKLHFMRKTYRSLRVMWYKIRGIETIPRF